jgi:K+-sensing histidine kinase KdpD
MMKMLTTAVSHDMMNPIANIKFFAQQLLESSKTRNEAEMDKYYQMIEDSTKLVSSRMKDLLDQGLIEHGSFVPIQSEFDPRAAVGQLTRISRHLSTNIDVQIIESYSPTL